MNETANPSPMSYEELLLENQALQRELHERKTRLNSIWKMLSETNRRLQASSASIKAAVSSLLNYDIFWDVANQHEFLETIDSSVDQAGRLVMLLTLAFHLEAGSLELTPDVQELQEIVLDVLDRRAEKFPNFSLKVDFPEGGRPVRLDYKYFAIAFEYLLEVIQMTQTREVQVQAVQEASRWSLRMKGISASMAQMIKEMTNCEPDVSTASNLLSPEHLLRLHVACQLLHMQNVDVNVQKELDNQPVVYLDLPAY